MKRFGYLAIAATAVLPLARSGAAAEAASPNPDPYKAIAFAPSANSIPYVRSASTQAGAETSALSRCRESQSETPPEYGRDCRGAVWVYNGWLSFESVSAPGAAWGAAWAPTRARAEYLALSYCESRPGGSGCTLRTIQVTQPLLRGVSARGALW